jgi:hypothetical protein
VHVVPVRFIVMCERGHLDEFPWDFWVKHEASCPPARRILKLEGGPTAGLAGLVLSCTGCNANRTMEGAFGSESIPPQCHGRRPWLGVDADEPNCQGRPRVVQRGASNIYFSATDSALDIPPWSDELQKKIGMRWSMLEQAPDDAAREALIAAMRLAELTGQSNSELSAIIADRVARLRTPDRNIRWEEYQQFIQHTKAFGENTDFEIRPSTPPAELTPWIQLVTRATRLREVRALRGFTRVFPPSGGGDQNVALLSLRPLSWLPAIENRGEGIFIQLKPAAVIAWENQPNVRARVAHIASEYEHAWRARERGGAERRAISPRLLLVHSLAHVMIRQLSLSCGYSGASLRERLYVGERQWDMAGFLVFTSSPDADGTLGGLARQGLARNLVPLFEEGLASMTWCSSDPLCIEGVHALTEPSSGAACHSCLLAAETSCEEFNSFLDRALLVGTPTDPKLGFFSEYIAELRGA